MTMKLKHRQSKQAVKAVRIRLIQLDLSFSAYCREKGYTRQYLGAALLGNWTGPKAEELVRPVCQDLGIVE